jgi:hypothetical protein
MGFFLRHERRAQLIRDKEWDELVEANPDVVFFTECGMRESFDKAQLKLIDRWIAKQNDPVLDRTSAVRRLVEIGLKAKTAAKAHKRTTEQMRDARRQEKKEAANWGGLYLSTEAR